jgi:hypothetical protein
MVVAVNRQVRIIQTLVRIPGMRWIIVFLRVDQLQRWINIGPLGSCGKATIIFLNTRYVMVGLEGRHNDWSDSGFERARVISLVKR